MKEQTTIQRNKKKGSIYRNFIELVAVGSVTGVFAGTIVTFFSILVREGEHISQDVYAYVRENPAFIPLLLLALVAVAFLVGTAMRISTVVRGGGVPQAEGASRGFVPLKWWRDLILMFAATLCNVFMGLSVGSEGPSILIGACAGDGVSSVLRRNQMIRKYQITGGACAGLAVAMGAPLMGMAFAFEEAHKRFTPEVFICAFASVIFGMLSRLAIYAAMGMQVANSFASYAFFDLPAKYYLYVVLAGVLCGGLGVAFYKLCFACRKLFKKITGKTPGRALYKRVLTVTLLGGAVSLLAAPVMGGGHGFIESLGTFGGAQEANVASVFGMPLFWTVLVVLLLRIFITLVNVGGGIPCGILIPILSIGACVGALLNEGFTGLGMEEKYCDIMVMICIAAFFTTVVRAPLTAIIMVCELTGSFAPLLPVIIAVSIGYMIGEMCRTEGIYEDLLAEYEKETGIHERAVQKVYTLTVESGALADKREVRNVLWPAGARLTEIRRGEEILLPEGETLLQGGDILTVVCKSCEQDKTKEELTHIVGSDGA